MENKEKIVLNEIIVEEKLTYLSDTDIEEAEKESEFEDLKREEKSFISDLKINTYHNYKSDSERTTHALASNKYTQEFRPKLKKAHKEFKEIRNKRNTADRIISVWQTQYKRGSV